MQRATQHIREDTELPQSLDSIASEGDWLSSPHGAPCTADPASSGSEHLVDTPETDAYTRYSADIRTHEDKLEIHHLPNELLSEIFTVLLPKLHFLTAPGQAQAIDEYNSYRKTIGCVCFRWMQVLRATPKCWSLFHLHARAFQDNQYPPQQLVDAFQNSSYAPLSIVLDVMDDAVHGSNLGSEIINRPMKFLSAHFHHTERLTVMTDRREHAVNFLSWRGSFGSAIEHMRVELDDEDLDGEPILIEPTGLPILSLKSFAFATSAYTVSVSPKDVTDTQRLTLWRGKVSSRSHDVSEIMDYLEACPSLLHLDIGIIPIDNRPVSGRCHTFPELRLLRLHDHASALIHPPHAPNLKALSLSNISSTSLGHPLSVWLSIPCPYAQLRSLSVALSEQWDDIIYDFVRSTATLDLLVLAHGLDHRTDQSVASFIDRLQLPSIEPNSVSLEIIPDSGQLFRGQIVQNPEQGPFRIEFYIMTSSTTQGFKDTVIPAIRRLLDRFPLLFLVIRPRTQDVENLRRIMGGAVPRLHILPSPVLENVSVVMSNY